MIFKPKTVLNGDLKYFDFVVRNQPSHLRHFEPVDVAERLTGLGHAICVASPKLVSEMPMISIFLQVRSMWNFS